MVENDCPTKLLEDSPTNEDQFGSHEKVAEFLGNLINSEEKKGGKSIALTGTWGSGKTSVIEILKEKLNNKVKLFSYNTWSHEGDPLRRSFLEELIDFLDNENWLEDEQLKDDETWEERKEKLSGQIREETIERTPNLKKRAIKFGLLALLVPFGVTLLPHLISFSYPYYFLAIVPSLFILTPLIYGIYLYYKEFVDVEEEEKTKKSGFGFIFQKSEVDIDSQTWMSPEPTSVEFQNTFSELMDYSISNQDRQLIIVMDNIDRINPDEALEVWSTMRTFLDFSRERDWFENLWIIVPFDEESIRKLWEGRYNTEKNKGNGLSNAFLEKTFQVKVHVPRPLLSNWKDFFIENLREALPEHTSENFEEVCKVFSLQREDNTRAPTPREIKLFINKIGALHRQWGHEGYKIPLKHMALFVSLGDRGWEPDKDLVDPDELDKKLEDRTKTMLDENWQKHLACFHVKKPPQEAIEILLKPQIKDAIRNNDDTAMNDMLGVEGFPHILDQYLDELLGGDVEQNYDIPILASLIPDTSARQEGVWVMIWNKMAEFVSDVSHWEEMNLEVGKGLVNILDFKERRETLTLNIENLANSLSGFAFDKQKKEVKKEVITGWLKGVMEVIKHIEGPQEVESDFKENFCVSGSFDIFLEVSSMLDNGDFSTTYYKFFKPELGVEKTIEELGDRCEQDNYNKSCLSAVRIIKSIKGQSKWGPLLDKINNYFEDQSKTLADQECTALIRTLLEIGEDNKRAIDTLDNLSSNGRFAHHLSKSFKDNSAGAGSLIFTILSSQPNLNNLKNWNQAHQGRNFIRNNVFKNHDEHSSIANQFIDLLSTYSYSSFKNIVQIPKKEEGAKPFFRKLIQIVLDKKDITVQRILKESTDFEIFLNEFLLIEDIFSEKSKVLKRFVARIEVEQNFSSRLASLGFNIDSARLYNLLLGADHSEDFVDFIKTEINEIDRETWEKQLRQAGPLIDLLITFNEEKRPISLNNLSNGLSDYTKKIMEEGIEPKDKVSSNFQLILSFLSESSKVNLLDKVRNMIIQTKKASNKDLSAVVEMYQPDINDWGRWKDEIDDTITFVFDKIAESGNEKEIEWMEEFIKKNSDKIHPENVNGLTDFVQKLDDLKDEDHPHLQNVYEHLAEKVNNNQTEEEE